MKTKQKAAPKVNVITLGCSKNLVDSEVLIGQLEGNNISAAHQSDDASEIVIVNTCGFIETAKQESINTILQYADARSEGRIEKLFVTGCLSHRYKDDLKREIPDVDAWFGTLELPLLLEELGADYKQELIGERIGLSTPNHYAYLKISEGCNRTCSFCAIPLMRGKHISKPIEKLVQEAQNLVKKGVKEVMLIAQELTYYGLDVYKKRKLADLLRHLSDIDGLEWIRLHYAYPHKFPLEVIDVMAERQNICNYLDMPLQHFSDPVLERMKRQLTSADTINLVDKIRQRLPEIAMRTTMLVGFPGETEKDFEQLLKFVEDTRFERLGVFEYSHEEGTTAHDLVDSIEPEVKKDRTERLMALQQEISYDLNQKKVGKVFKVLFDRKEGSQFIGRTEFDSPEVDNEVIVDAANNYVRVGDFAPVRITQATEFDLYGELA